MIELIIENRSGFFIQQHFIRIRTVDDTVIKSSLRQIFRLRNGASDKVTYQNCDLRGAVPIVIESRMGKMIFSTIQTSQTRYTCIVYY